MGRPTGDQRRREQICAMFTEEEKRIVCEIAAKKQMLPGIYLRTLVLQAIATVAA